jgi:hypothetical protein
MTYATFFCQLGSYGLLPYDVGISVRNETLPALKQGAKWGKGECVYGPMYMLNYF